MNLAAIARKTAAGLLKPFLGIRNLLYDIRLLPVINLGVPVVSIGNIHMGGTGKTPIVHDIAQRLNSQGHHPAVLLRGYGGTARGSHLVHGNDKPSVMGDEAVMLATMPGNITVVRGPDRLASWKLALAEGADCAILDDGLQHRRIARDLEIVVLDSLRPLPWDIAPAGSLREGFSALSRADLVILSRADFPSFANEIRQLVSGKYPELKTCNCRNIATGLSEMATGTILPSEHARGKRILAFSGIGNPESFHQSLRNLGAESVTFLDFPDHCTYGTREYNLINRTTEDLKPDFLVCTRKDLVKLDRSAFGNQKVFSLEIKTGFNPSDSLDRALEKLMS